MIDQAFNRRLVLETFADLHQLLFGLPSMNPFGCFEHLITFVFGQHIFNDNEAEAFKNELIHFGHFAGFG
ncbi:hypothetical protein D3C83_184120 [compost metagenome]